MIEVVRCPHCKEYAEINFDNSIDDGEEFGNLCNHCGQTLRDMEAQAPSGVAPSRRLLEEVYKAA